MKTKPSAVKMMPAKQDGDSIAALMEQLLLKIGEDPSRPAADDGDGLASDVRQPKFADQTQSGGGNRKIGLGHPSSHPSPDPAPRRKISATRVP